MMNGLPVTAAMSEVLPLLQQCLNQGASRAGVAVIVHPAGEPRARDTGLGGLAALHHLIVSVSPFLHCFHHMGVSTTALPLVSRRRQRSMKKGQVIQARPYLSFSSGVTP